MYAWFVKNRLSSLKLWRSVVARERDASFGYLAAFDLPGECELLPWLYQSLHIVGGYRQEKENPPGGGGGGALSCELKCSSC